MALPKRARLFRKNGVWHVSYWQDGRRVRESTGAPNRKVAEEVRLQREREMILGTVTVEREIATALCDPTRREALLTALAPGSLITVQKALEEYEVHSNAFKRPKTIDNDQRRLKDFLASIYLLGVLISACSESPPRRPPWRRKELAHGRCISLLRYPPHEPVASTGRTTTGIPCFSSRACSAPAVRSRNSQWCHLARG